MIRIMYGIIAGIITIIAVIAIFLFGSDFTGAFFAAKGSSAAVGGVTANEAIGMKMLYAFGAASLVAVPAGLGIRLFMGGDSRNVRRR
jgi:hypothetical protein